MVLLVCITALAGCSKAPEQDKPFMSITVDRDSIVEGEVVNVTATFIFKEPYQVRGSPDDNPYICVRYAVNPEHLCFTSLYAYGVVPPPQESDDEDEDTEQRAPGAFTQAPGTFVRMVQWNGYARTGSQGAPHHGEYTPEDYVIEARWGHPDDLTISTDFHLN
jgi:hypothetical protein